MPARVCTIRPSCTMRQYVSSALRYCTVYCTVAAVAPSNPSPVVAVAVELCSAPYHEIVKCVQASLVRLVLLINITLCFAQSLFRGYPGNKLRTLAPSLPGYAGT